MVNSSYSSGSIRRVTLATILVITIFYQEYQYGAVNSSQNTSSLKSIQSNNPFTFHIVFQTTR
jgi:hypothetical protein